MSIISYFNRDFECIKKFFEKIHQNSGEGTENEFIQIDVRPQLKTIKKANDLDKEIKASGCYNEIKDIECIEYEELSGLGGEINQEEDKKEEDTKEGEKIQAPKEEQKQEQKSSKEEKMEDITVATNIHADEENKHDAVKQNKEKHDSGESAKVKDVAYIKTQVRKQIRNESTKNRCKRNKNKDKKTMKQKESIKDMLE